MHLDKIAATDDNDCGYDGIQGPWSKENLNNAESYALFANSKMLDDP